MRTFEAGSRPGEAEPQREERAAHIHLHIDRVVVMGLPALRPEQLHVALEQALHERLGAAAQDGLPAAVSTRHLDAQTTLPVDAGLTAIVSGVADAVVGGLWR